MIGTKKILVIEDEKDIRNLLKDLLEKEKMVVFGADNVEQAEEILEDFLPDLIILDLELPGKMYGMDYCRCLKSQKKTEHIPIIMLTAETSEKVKILGLDTGADDYVTKPFKAGELVARIKALFRRIEHSGETEVVLKAGNIVMNVNERTVYINKKQIYLTKKEFDLLFILMKKKGQLVRRETLFEQIWGWGAESDVFTRAVDFHIKNIRQKLPGAKVKIVTVRDFGYKLED